MAKLQRAVGFYPSGDEPTNVWGLFPAGTATVAPMRIPPGVLVSTLVNGNIENDGTHFYVTLNNTRYIISVAKIVTAKGDLLVASAGGILARLAVGANGQLLIADSTQETGVKWGYRIDDVAILAPAAAAAWIDQPADLTELFGLTIHRAKFDLTTANQARISVNVAAAGATGAKLAAQYSTDQSTWYYLDGSSGPAAGIDSAGLVVSSWVNLATGAKADVFLRMVGLGGNGTADPAFGRTSIQFR